MTKHNGNGGFEYSRESYEKAQQDLTNVSMNIDALKGKRSEVEHEHEEWRNLLNEENPGAPYDEEKKEIEAYAKIDKELDPLEKERRITERRLGKLYGTAYNEAGIEDKKRECEILLPKIHEIVQNLEEQSSQIERQTNEYLQRAQEIEREVEDLVHDRKFTHEDYKHIEDLSQELAEIKGKLGEIFQQATWRNPKMNHKQNPPNMPSHTPPKAPESQGTDII